MKTRIISGIVASLLLVCILVINGFWSPVSAIMVALLSAIASYEMLRNTTAVKNSYAVIIAMVYSAVAIFTSSGILKIPTVAFTVVYVLAIAVLTLVCYGSFKIEEMAMCISMPILIAFSFSCLERIINYSGLGIFLLIMLLNFSSVADCGAYFTGVAIGRHKLAPIISPKKTVEGFIGGLVTAMVGTVVICLIFNAVTDKTANILGLCLITPIMVVIGVIGDLFTSAIKRTYGIKDYGNIMPGHGGVLDRCDSILFCAPVLALLLRFMEVVY